MYREASSKLVESFAMVAWSIWERQNRIRERQKVWGVDEVCARASEMLKEFHGVHRKIPRLVVRSGDVRWKPPALQLELCITAAYGNILPRKFLNIPPLG